MKKIIVLSVLVLLTCQLFSQSQYKYTVGDTIVGKNVKYVCKEREDKPSYLRIDNITNKDTSSDMNYTNGELISMEEVIVGRYEYEEKDVYGIVREIFTESELKILKEKKYIFRIIFLTNNQGVTQEISFLFAKNAEVLSTFAPDRFYQLENKLKKTLKVKIEKESQHVRNPKWDKYIDFSAMQ